MLSRAEHGVSRSKISPNAIKVLAKLNQSGYQAFIVGGGVRDILLGLTPKDFDIATDATPEEVKAVFRNSRIIGRRFRIVHVHFGREIIEVSTFRALSNDSVEVPQEKLSRKVKNLDSAHSASGMILRDNVYGTLEEDVIRRDFTVNAMYYTIQNFEVHDYMDGINDIQKRCLRMIGEPEKRYREDPVRILRAIRLAAKLDFNIEENTEAPIASSAVLLESIPAARLFDEFIKLFFAGYGEKTYQLLQEYGVFPILFPATLEIPEQDQQYSDRVHSIAFASTDRRINEGKSVTPAFLLAAILWPAVRQQYQTLLSSNLPAATAMQEAGSQILSQQLERLSIPKRFSIPMREIWDMQLRLPNRRGKRAETLLRNKRFRAAYDFVLIREGAGEDMDELGAWWTQYQSSNKAEREKMQDQLMSHSNSQQHRVKSSRSGAKKSSRRHRPQQDSH